MRVTRMMWYAGTVLTALAMLAASATAAAQQQGRTMRVRTGAAARDSSAAERQKTANIKRFRGIAAQLNTTPEALEAKQAKQAADRQAKDAERRVKDADKRARANGKEAKQKSNGKQLR